LKAEPPLRMLQAVVEGEFGVSLSQEAVHGLQIETRKLEGFEDVRLGALLREHKFQLISGPEHQIGPCLRADTRPVDPPWWEPGSVRLDRDLEPLGVERFD